MLGNGDVSSLGNEIISFTCSKPGGKKIYTLLNSIPSPSLLSPPLLSSLSSSSSLLHHSPLPPHLPSANKDNAHFKNISTYCLLTAKQKSRHLFFMKHYNCP